MTATATATKEAASNSNFQNERWVTVIISSRWAAGSDPVIIAGTHSHTPTRTCWRACLISTGGLGADSQPGWVFWARMLHRALPVLGIESILVFCAVMTDNRDICQFLFNLVVLTHTLDADPQRSLPPAIPPVSPDLLVVLVMRSALPP